MHSNARVLVELSRGSAALPARLVLFNMISAGRALFFAAGEVLASAATRNAYETLTKVSRVEPE